MTLEPLPEVLKKTFSTDALVYENDSHFFYGEDFDKDLLKDIQEHNFQVYNGTYRHNYEDGTTLILLNGRGKTCGKKIFKIENFFPYCYIDSSNGDRKTYLNKTVEKVIFHTEPRTVADYRKQRSKTLETVPYEADVPFVQRFMIDTYDFFQPSNYIMPTVAILDVETNFPVSDNIISFALNSYGGELYYNSAIMEGSGYGLILDMYSRIIKYDVLTNWNIEFDLTELKKKIEYFQMFLKPIIEGYELTEDEYIKHLITNNLHIKVKSVIEVIRALREYDVIRIEDNIVKLGTLKLDEDLDFIVTPVELKPVTKKMLGREIPGRWTLDNVGTRLCGISKVDLEGRYPRELDQDELFEYNIRDVIIPEIIDEYLGGIPCHVILSWSIHAMINDSITTAIVNDIALLRNYHHAGLVLGSRSSQFKAEGEEEGDGEPGYDAAEPDARPGVYENVVISDLHAAYPSAVLAINASCETKDPNGRYLAPNGVKFNEGKSVFIDTLTYLLHEREKLKSQLKKTPKNTHEYKTLKFIDFALKTQVAAFSHGIFGWVDSRMKDMEVADAITATVRGILDIIKEYVDTNVGQWVYVHTDSCYFIKKTDIKDEEVLKNLNDTIEVYCKAKGYSIIPHLDYKGFYPKAYIHSAARNVLVDDKGEWEVTGMNFDRSEVPEPLAEIERTLIQGKLDYKTNDELLKILRELIKGLKECDTRDLGILKPLTKPIKKYGRNKDGQTIGIPYHIKALLLAEKDYGFKVKVKEKFLMLPILLDEWEGVRVKRRKRAFIAYSIEEGLPANYIIDWENYLDSNLWGKLFLMFGFTKKKELKQTVMTEEMKSFMYGNV
jgi:DNA polymerase elongation subunit (family B)